MTKFKTTLRLPVDVMDFVRAKARQNGSSQTSEIIRAVRAQMTHSDQQSVNLTNNSGQTLQDANHASF